MIHIDLTEQPEVALEAEILRRRLARRRGLCDYCGRLPDEPACKFPTRHVMPAEMLRNENMAEAGRILTEGVQG